MAIREDLRDTPRRMTGMTSVGLLFFSLIILNSAGTQSDSQSGIVSNQPHPILGIWRVIHRTSAADRAATTAAASDIYLVVTAKSYGVIMTNQPRPDFADVVDAHADDLRALWGQKVRHAGTYELHAHNQLALQIGADDAVVTETWINVLYEVAGDSLILRDRERRITRLARVR
jgi:hypothetical protein